MHCSEVVPAVHISHSLEVVCLYSPWNSPKLSSTAAGPVVTRFMSCTCMNNSAGCNMLAALWVSKRAD